MRPDNMEAKVMSCREVWIRWEGEDVAEVALRPSDEGAWTKYVPASDLLPLQAALAVERSKPKVRPGHHPPCKAMFDSEAVCTCGQ